MSAVTPIADKRGCGGIIRFVPIADINVAKNVREQCRGYSCMENELVSRFLRPSKPKPPRRPRCGICIYRPASCPCGFTKT
jgi:hypothetical protein